MQLVLYISSVLLGYHLSSSKKNSLNRIVALLFFGCIFFFVLNSALTIPDAQNYYFGYGSIDGYYSISSSILRFVQIPFARVGISFPTFKAIIYLLFFLFVSISFKKINANSYSVILLVLLSILFTSAIQIRNFCATCFLTIGLTFLVKGDKSNRLKYLFFYILACLFHTSFVVYAIFLIPFPKNKRTRRVLFGILTFIFLVAFITLFFNKNIFLNLVLRFGFFDEEKVAYYTSSVTKLGPIIVLLTQIFTITMFYSCFKRLKKKNEKSSNYLERILFLNVLAFSLCCFSLFDLNFYRLIRNIAFINFAGITIFWDKNKKVINTASLLSYMYWVLWFIVDVFLLHSFQQIVTPFFN